MGIRANALARRLTPTSLSRLSTLSSLCEKRVRKEQKLKNKTIFAASGRDGG